MKHWKKKHMQLLLPRMELYLLCPSEDTTLISGFRMSGRIVLDVIFIQSCCPFSLTERRE